MAYATPSDMLRYFGESELAQIAAPEDETVTASDITDMIRGNNSGYSSSEADADPLNRLQEALDDASMLIDSYLAGRYATPATDTNATEVLRRPCAELADAEQVGAVHRTSVKMGVERVIEGLDINQG